MTLEAAYAAYHDRLLRACHKWTRCAEDAEDVASRTFEILMSKPEQLDVDHLLQWLYVVARNEAFALYRRRRDREDTLPPSNALRPDGWNRTLGEMEDLMLSQGAVTHAESVAEWHLLLELVPRMTRGRRIGVLSCVLGLSFEETMAAFGCTRTQVNRWRTDGRNTLRELANDPAFSGVGVRKELVA